MKREMFVARRFASSRLKPLFVYSHLNSPWAWTLGRLRVKIELGVEVMGTVGIMHARWAILPAVGNVLCTGRNSGSARVGTVESNVFPFRSKAVRVVRYWELNIPWTRKGDLYGQLLFATLGRAVNLRITTISTKRDFLLAVCLGLRHQWLIKQQTGNNPGDGQGRETAPFGQREKPHRHQESSMVISLAGKNRAGLCSLKVR